MDKLPPELIIMMMKQSETITDLVRLASVNKSAHAIYNKHAVVILDKVARPKIDTFDDALAVVRATEIVKDAYACGTLPPRPFPLGHLTRRYQLPDVDEYRAVVNMIHLVNILEAEHSAFMKELGDNYVWCWRPLISVENFNQAILHGLLYNAFMAGEFAEPFYLSAQKTPSTKRVSNAKFHHSNDTAHKVDGRDDYEYLRQFSVYKDRYTNANNMQHDSLLSSLVEFFGKKGVSVSAKDLHPGNMHDKFRTMWSEYGIGHYDEDISNTHYSEAPPSLAFITQHFNDANHVNRILIGLVHTIWQLPGEPHRGKSYNRRRTDEDEHPTADVILFGELNVRCISFAPKLGRHRVDDDILFDIYERTQLALEKTYAPRNVKIIGNCLDLLKRAGLSKSLVRYVWG